MGRIFIIGVVLYFSYITFTGRTFWGGGPKKAMPKGQRYYYNHK